jgi:hypothetical protein
MFSISVKTAGMIVEGRGLTKKAAKTEAARIALQMMRSENSLTTGVTILDVLDGKVNPTPITGNPVNGLKHLLNNSSSGKQTPEIISSSSASAGSDHQTAAVKHVAQVTGMMESMSVGDPSPAEDHYVVQNLYALCGKNGFSNPEYEEISVTGTSHEPLFTIRVTVRSLNVSATATGRSKIAAKRTAASELLSQLRDHVPGSGEGKSLTGGSADLQDQDLEYKHRIKYRIPTIRHAAPSIVFELFRQIENSKFPLFDECLSRREKNDDSFDYFAALCQICTVLGIKAVTHENEAVSKNSGTSYESIIMLSFKEIPIMTTYASSEVSREAAIQETAFRSVVSLCCSQKLAGGNSSNSNPAANFPTPSSLSP